MTLFSPSVFGANCLALLGVALLVTGCASGRKTYRHGLMDRFVAGSAQGALALDRQDEVPRLSGRDLASVRQDVSRWSWPLRKVRVTSAFGQREPNFHEGIDLEANSGTPIRAVRSGLVVYADDEMGGYGKLTIIKHGGNLFSLYAHQSRMLVKAGERVLQDQRIGYTGATGRASN